MSTAVETTVIRRLQWLPASILASVLAGVCTFLFKVTMLAGVDLYLLNLTTSGLFILTAYVAVVGRNRKLAVKVTPLAIGSGLLAGLGQVCYFAAIASGPISVVAVFFNLYPAVTIALSMMFLGERLSWQRAIGVAFAFLASVFLLA